MRKWVVLLLALGSAAPAMAAKNLSIEQMEQLLAKLHGKPDGKVAQEIFDVELTERVSGARLARWEKENPGERTREALVELADLSLFLKAPRGDAVPDPAPDEETQQKMLWLAVEYVKTTITRLPNFIATRETTYYESEPETRTDNGLIVNRFRDLTSSGGSGTLRRVGSNSVTVTFREGHEVHDGKPATKKQDSPPSEMTSVGEFGPILEVVLGDAMRGAVEWQRWEAGESDPVAVFRYEVPEQQSHYTAYLPREDKLEAHFPAYYGEIAIDPATGAILWLSLQSHMQPPFDKMRAAIEVEYAPVAIGERNYICPVKSVAWSTVPAFNPNIQRWNGPLTTFINDVTFKNYHVFRTESKIVSDGSGQPASDPAPASRPQP